MPDEELTFRDLNTALLAEFPRLRDTFAAKIGDFAGWEPGQYVVFGSVFNDYVEEAALLDASVRSRIARFIERMATASDEEIEQLLTIEVLPTLLKRQEIVDAYWPELGLRTHRLLSLMAPRLAPDIRLPSRENESA